MFIALMAHTEFFKEHANLVIALGPVMFLNNLKVDFIKVLSPNKLANDSIKKMGPELLPDPASIHPFFNNVHSVMESSQHMSVQYFSDSKPELTSSVALINYGGHFPAGSSYKSFEHFHQVYETKKF